MKNIFVLIAVLFSFPVAAEVKLAFDVKCHTGKNMDTFTRGFKLDENDGEVVFVDKSLKEERYQLMNKTVDNMNYIYTLPSTKTSYGTTTYSSLMVVNGNPGLIYLIDAEFKGNSLVSARESQHWCRWQKYAINKQFKQTANAWHFQLGLASVIMVENFSVLVALSAT